MKSALKTLVVLCMLHAPLNGFGPFGALFDKEWESVQTFSKTVEKNIEELEKRKQQAKTAVAALKGDLEKAQKSHASLKERAQRARNTELDYLNQRLLIANKTMQVLSESVQSYQELIDVVDAHIKLLQEYKEDPEFKKKGFFQEQKALYTIEDFQRINSIVIHYADELLALQERAKNAASDSETLKKNGMLAAQEWEDKKREQKMFRANPGAYAAPERKKFSTKQQGELIDAEEQLLGYKKELADAKLKLSDAKALYLEQAVKVTTLILEMLEKEEEHVQQELRVEKKDIAAVELALKNQAIEAQRLQEDYNRRIDSLNLLRQNELQLINQYRQRAGLSTTALEAIYAWNDTPSTISGWQSQVELGRLNNHIVYEIDILKDTLVAKGLLERARVTELEVQNQIIRTWQLISNGALDGYNAEELSKAIKSFEKSKADILATIAALAEKRSAASAALSNNARIGEAVKARLAAFREQKDTTFKSHQEEFNRLGMVLKDEAFKHTQQRGEIIAQLIELYSSLSNNLNLSIKKIDTMLRVLGTKSQWKGAPPLWKGLKRFIPDMAKFWAYLTAGKRISQSVVTSRKAVGGWFSTVRDNPGMLGFVLLYLVLLLLLFFALKAYLPVLATAFSQAVRPEYHFFHAITLFMSAIFAFVGKHIRGLFAWCLLLLAVRYGAIPHYWGVIFYLLSIPFWLYYCYRFIYYLKAVNVSRGYLFTSQRYQRRFFMVLSFLLAASTCILLLREAVLLVLPKSDAPRILLAFNFVILQVSLILMIAREQLLSLIPRTTPLWEWVYEQVSQYYSYFLAGLIFIIVMSNPYIGYGPAFFYAITRLALILLLLPLVKALHDHLKRSTGTFFFYTDEEGIKERFKYGKTAYGLLVIASFLFFSFVGFLIAAHIWGYSIGLSDISAWLSKEIYKFESVETGRYISVNAFDFAKVFLYLLAGIAIAYVVNNFIFRRMFDLLLVNVGVQSALLALSRYSIFIAALIIGLRSVGASYSLLYVFAVLGGLGVAGKEIITDFIGYFVILVQRPIKIGDYVKIDDELTGVVRHVTFRSVIMRRQNSVTVIIPNSMVMTKTVVNWNYSRTFFAFDDIFLTISYSSDPSKVKALMHQILDGHPKLLKNPAPIVRLNDFGDNGFQFLIRGFLSPDKVLEQHDIASDVRLELVRVLRTNGFEVGSPTRVLRIVQETPRERASEAS